MNTTPGSAGLEPANDLRGLWVPVITPLDANQNVDIESLRGLVRRILADGARGIVALGTTGEPATLSAVEQQMVVEVVAEECSEVAAGLIVGAGTNSTRTTISALQSLDHVPGVSAALVVVPYYTRPSTASIVAHFQTVADESPVPIVAYNVPYRTGRGLAARDLLQIAESPKVIGLKQAVGCLDADTLEVLRSAPPRFQVLAGDDAFIVPTILLGGTGSITAAAHLHTPLFVEMVTAALRGQALQSRALAERLLPVVTAGFAEPNPSVWKAALCRLGEIVTPALRAPMGEATAAATDNVMKAICDAKQFAPSNSAP